VELADGHNLVCFMVRAGHGKDVTKYFTVMHVTCS
jgi:hypothetical protein